MMSDTNTVKLVLGYEGDTSRSLIFNDVADSVAAGVKNNVKALNASLKAGLIDDFKSFFVDAAGHSTIGITEAYIINVESEDFDVTQEG